MKHHEPLHGLPEGYEGDTDSGKDDLNVDPHTRYPRVVPYDKGNIIHFGGGSNSGYLTSEQTKQLLFELVTKTNPPAILQRPNLMRFVCALGIAVGVAIGVGFMSLVIIVLVKFF